MEHFETLWEKSEQISKQYYQNPLHIIDKIKGQLDDLIKSEDQNDRIEHMGNILLDLSFISDQLNINVYAALKNTLDDIKIKMFDPEP